MMGGKKEKVCLHLSIIKHVCIWTQMWGRICVISLSLGFHNKAFTFSQVFLSPSTSHMSFWHMLLSMTSLQIRYLSLLMNIISHLAHGQSAVQMYVISVLAAASVWTEDSKRCYFVRGGYIFNTIRPSKRWRCKRSGWQKTVTVSDSLGGNVINCKWTGAWYFKMQPKQHFEMFTLLFCSLKK